MNERSSFRLKYERLRRKKTQKDVADFLGLTKQAVQRYESGLSTPKLETWQKLADYFDVDAGYLQGLTDIKDPRTISKLEFSTVVKNTDLLDSNKLNSIGIDDAQDAVLLLTSLEEIYDASDTISNIEIRSLVYSSIVKILKLAVSEEISDDQKITSLKKIKSSVNSVLKQTRVNHDE